MGTLKDALMLDSKKLIVNCSKFEECISELYSARFPDYRFFENSELIDVNDRFRIFDFCGTRYISKRVVSEVAALNERKLSQEAYLRIDGVVVNDRKLRVVVPDVFVSGEIVCLVSEYLGNTLQESIYSGVKDAFSLENLSDLLNLLMENEIMHRGLLPRNIVCLPSGEMALFDWEDAIIGSNASVSYNHSWLTNLQLNWGGYFFDKLDVERMLSQYLSHSEDKVSLITYEKEFAVMTGLQLHSSELRSVIKKVVLYAEAPLKQMTDSFCIAPHDMAHLLSDLFPVAIDVLFDLIVFIVRAHNEFKYRKYLLELSNAILLCYRSCGSFQHFVSPILFDFFSEGYKSEYEICSTKLEEISYYISDLINCELPRIMKLNVKVESNVERVTRGLRSLVVIGEKDGTHCCI